jgi:AcrR family transcriptional regulator
VTDLARSHAPSGEMSAARRRIVEVARTQFSSRGYDRTPLRAIADALGVTKAAVYHHFQAKEDLLAVIVTPMLERVDDLVAASPDGALSAPARRELLGHYVDVLGGEPEVTALLLRDPGVAEHPLGRRFAAQREQIRSLLGPSDDPATVIRTTAAVGALELAVVEFGRAHPDQVPETALSIAIAVLDSGGPVT